MTTNLITPPAAAPGQALGYGLQYTRLTAMLLDAEPGSMCSLEVLDDVSEQTPDDTTTLVQSKSALTANPVGDHSVSLWKTFFNWLELTKLKIVDPARTIFELYVSRPVSGGIIDAFHKATSIEAAKSAIVLAGETLSGKGTSHAGRHPMSSGLIRYAGPVLGAAEDMAAIIVNFRFVCGSGSPQSDIENSIRRDPVSESRVSDIADKLCGWVKREADKLLERDLPAVISRDDFHREYVSYVRRIDRELILTGLAKRPSEAEKQEHLPDVFVQQLDLIELDFDEKLQAISDFLRACWDRAHWSKTGDVHEDSFIELDDNLTRTWRNHSREVKLDSTLESAERRGVLLYSRCMNHRARVQGMEPPSHFVPGCFHVLADGLYVGWHPEHRALLGEKTSIHGKKNTND